MLQRLYTLVLLLSTFTVYSQQPDANRKDSSWQLIKLQSINKDKGIFEYNSLRPAIIYLSLADIRNLSLEKLKSDQRKEEYKDILIYLDSSGLKSDTVLVAENTSELDHLVAEILERGQARVFDIHHKKFIDSIHFRLEKYGSDVWKFYYFPDKKPFFGVMESSGNIEENDDPLKTIGKHAGEYKLLADKLKKIWKRKQ